LDPKGGYQIHPAGGYISWKFTLRNIATAAALRSMAGLFGHAKVLETIQLAGPVSLGEGESLPLPVGGGASWRATECGRCRGLGRGGGALPSHKPSVQTARAQSIPPITPNPPHQHTQALVKEVIAKGKGAETPPPGAEVSAHYVGKLPSGADFDSRYVAYSSPPSRLFARLPEP
jgi:hypothetical protein